MFLQFRRSYRAIFTIGIIAFVFSCAISQSDYIEPKCIVVATGKPCKESIEGDGLGINDWDIQWQKDGSVNVGWEEVQLTSGIKKYYSENQVVPTYDYEMILVAPEDFMPPTTSRMRIVSTIPDGGRVDANNPTNVVKYEEVVEYVYKPDDPEYKAYEESLGIVSKDRNKTGFTRVEMFRRSEKEHSSSNNVARHNFMFDLSNDDQVDFIYGCTTENNTADFTKQQVPFNAYDYYKNGWTRMVKNHRHVQSTNLFELWNKPESASKKAIIEDIVIIIAIAVVLVVAFWALSGISYGIQFCRSRNGLSFWSQRNISRGYYWGSGVCSSKFCIKACRIIHWISFNFNCGCRNRCDWLEY